ncbi:MAG: metal ABC transporter solute-binding protein, Zn/Mn family [Planctomycetaceae bacterium]
MNGSLRVHLGLWSALATASLLIGCSDPANSPMKGEANPVAYPGGTAPIRVVATVGMVADVVREVGGSRVHVTQLMGPGVDPHLYKGTRDDVRFILAADVVFYSGLMLEGKLADMLEKVSRKKPVVAITRELDPSSILQEEGTAGHADPHVWMDVAAWAKCVDVVAETLAEVEPASATQFHASARVYREKLHSLHRYGLEVMASVPPSGRVLITSHDAFQYFGRAYGLEVFGVQGLSTDSEAGLRQINSLVDMIVQRQVSAVFVESSVPQKSILAVVDGVASRGHRVIIGGELYSDAMGPGGSYEGTYVGMLDHNLTLVARSLGGKAPAGGMQGLLTTGSHQP